MEFVPCKICSLAPSLCRHICRRSGIQTFVPGFSEGNYFVLCLIECFLYCQFVLLFSLFQRRPIWISRLKLGLDSRNCRSQFSGHQNVCGLYPFLSGVER